jgi:hypothetical protein
MMPTVALPGGETVPALGQGTWYMGEQRGAAATEAAALRLGIELGMTLIDTAEMYASAARNRWSRRRSRAFGTRCSSSARCCRRMPRGPDVPAACERSLKRLKTDRIDLYLLHWRGGHPAGGNRGGVRGFAGSGEDSLLGRVEFGRVRHGATGRCRGVRPTRCCIIRTAAASSSICCRGARGMVAGDGVFAAGASCAAAAGVSGAAGGGGSAWGDAGAGGDRLGYAVGAGDLDPEGGRSGACARECRRRRDYPDERGPCGDRCGAPAAVREGGAGPAVSIHWRVSLRWSGGTWASPAWRRVASARMALAQCRLFC